jgi:hypothetical protein
VMFFTSGIFFTTRSTDFIGATRSLRSTVFPSRSNSPRRITWILHQLPTAERKSLLQRLFRHFGPHHIGLNACGPKWLQLRVSLRISAPRYGTRCKIQVISHGNKRKKASRITSKAPSNPKIQKYILLRLLMKSVQPNHIISILVYFGYFNAFVVFNAERHRERWGVCGEK